MNTGEHTDELNEAPLLRSIPKQDPFVVPDGFFDRFPHQVQAKIGNSGSQQVPLWSRLLRSPALIGSLALVLVVFFVWLFKPIDPAVSVAEVPGSFAQDEFALLDGFDDDQLYALWDDDAAPMSEVDIEMGTDDLIAYLENEEVPLYMLIEEL